MNEPQNLRSLKNSPTPVKNACKNTNMLQLPMNIEHVILINRMFFVFRIATYFHRDYIGYI